jgi:hypothetical protein
MPDSIVLKSSCRRLLGPIALATAILWSSVPAECASILFENTYGGYITANSMFTEEVYNTWGFEDFTLSSGATVTHASFTALQWLPDVPPIEWQLRRFNPMNPNLPEAVLASGYALNTVRTDIAPAQGFDNTWIREFHFEITPKHLEPGTYWLGLQVEDVSRSVFWLAAPEGNNVSALYSAGNWANPYPGTNLVFRVEGESDPVSTPVPEPGSTMALLGMALAGMGVCRSGLRS